jgi:hypothetical protein
MSWYGAQMTGDEVRAARKALGEKWGFDRPLHKSELGRACRLRGRDPGATVKEWEEKGTINGPASVCIDLFLAGALPPDGLAAVRGGR